MEPPAQEKSGKGRASGLEQGMAEGRSFGKSLQLPEMGGSAQARSAWRWPTHRDILWGGACSPRKEREELRKRSRANVSTRRPS